MSESTLHRRSWKEQLDHRLGFYSFEQCAWIVAFVAGEHNDDGIEVKVSSYFSMYAGIIVLCTSRRWLVCAHFHAMSLVFSSSISVFIPTIATKVLPR